MRLRLYLTSYSIYIRISILTTLCLFFLFNSKQVWAAADPAHGESLFKQNCTACHQINNKLVGPPLTQIYNKESEEWLIKWIRNNAQFRSTADKDALNIYNEYGKTEMPAFTQFSDDDIRSILAYIKQQDEKPANAPSAPGGAAPSGAPSFWLYAAIGILIIVAFLLMRTNKILKRMAYEKLGDHLPDEVPFWRALTNKKAIAIYVVILVFASGYAVTDSAMRLGHSKGYAPVQPIAFSHLQHAGINGINCLYCHVGAEKSKVASIPSVNVCMNCHKGVQAGENDEETKEIQKIYTYYNANKNIPWVRIYNLPDFVYFNHSQHVAVGKIACQTCHGPVESFVVQHEYPSLSMGWCINCHRQTPVQFTTNKYYGMYHEFQQELQQGKIGVVTEANMGGTECQKCHY